MKKQNYINPKTDILTFMGKYNLCGDPRDDEGGGSASGHFLGGGGGSPY